MKKKLILITILATLAWLWLGTTQQASGQYADVDTIWSVKAGTTTYLCQIAKFTPDYNYVLAAVGFQSWGTIRKYDAKTGEFISAFKDSTLEEIQDMV
ncbi:MAG: hypothetical protein QG635_522, partial [Bacteroidota bacterium]|nr:hypothetical protein [Bacteroidota bacterium]